MLDWIIDHIPDNVYSAGILAVGRHFISTGAGVLGMYLLTHHASQDQVTQITEGFSTLALALLSYGLSLKDVKGVDQKITQARSLPEKPQQTTDITKITQKSESTSQTSLPLFNKLNHPFGDIS